MIDGSASEPCALVCLELPAGHRYLSIISACLVALLERVENIAERDVVIYNMQLAVQEACTNIVDHAYGGEVGGRIEARFAITGVPRRLIVDLYDDGQPFDDSQANEPSVDEPQIHGYGLFLMRELMDGVCYKRLEGRNHWQLLKELREA